jgi:subtilase family serine protease
MTFSSRTRVTTAILLLSVTVATGISADDGHLTTARAARGLRVIGATRGTVPLDFSLVLRFDERGLSRYSGAVNDPHAQPYRGVLDPATIGRKFGLSTRVIRRIEHRLTAANLRVVDTYPQRTSIRLRGTVDAVERFFRVSYRDFVTEAGVRYLAPVNVPTIPKALRGLVDGVVGLSTRPRVQPADVRGGALEPIDAQIAYDVLPLHKLGVDGRDQKIAIASFVKIPRSGAGDLAQFDQRFGIDGPPPRSVEVAGGTIDVHVELSIDIDVVRAIAPKAQIIVFEAPNDDGGELAMFDQIAANKLGIDVVTYSWGRCDFELDPVYREGIEHALRIAAIGGINVFAASGDAGAYDCQGEDFENHGLSVGFPSDSPNVISVGGTLLAVRGDGRYLREFGWQDPLSNGGGGGGVNPVAPRPKWQPALGASASGPARRGVPDVSAAASPASPWWVSDSGGWETAGGTSAAAPFWAASILLVQQYAAKQGIRGSCFLAPLLYRLADEHATAFHDVTLGGNRHYGAGRGWDYATGLGSPDVYKLAKAMVAYRKRHGDGATCGG